MRKKLKMINRTKQLWNIIGKSADEIRKIKEKCRHEIIVEVSYHNLKYGYYRKECCIFCGENLTGYLDYKYKFSFINTDEKYTPTHDREYELVQHFYIEIAKLNPDMPIDEICKIIDNMIKSKNIKNYIMLRNSLNT